MKKHFISEAQRLQKLAGITEAKVVPANNTTYKWDKEINQLLSLYLSGDDNEYEPGYEHEFNINIELNTDDDLIPFYNFLKAKPNKTYIRPFKIPSVSVTANTEYEDEGLGDLIVKFTEPEYWPIRDIDEAKIVPQNTIPQEEIPEGWKEDNTDVGEEYNDGSIIVRYYTRQNPYSFLVPEHHHVYIAKRPNGEYYVQVMPSHDEGDYQSKPFTTFIEAKKYAFKEMDAVADAEFDPYDDNEYPDRYDED